MQGQEPDDAGKQGKRAERVSEVEDRAEAMWGFLRYGAMAGTLAAAASTVAILGVQRYCRHLLFPRLIDL